MKLVERICNIRAYILNKKRFRIVILILVLLTIKRVYRVNQEIGVVVFKHSENTAPCVLPEVDPFDPKMMEFVKNPVPITCSDPAIIYVDSYNNLQYNTTALKCLNESPDTVNCEVSLITRKTDDFNTISEPFLWKPSMNISGDFFRVKCKGANGLLFDNHLTRIERTPKRYKRLRESLKEDKYNVLLFGIDSMSRSAGIRQLPKVYKFLTETLGGYDFKGYTKVADNTFVNLVPLLSGRFAYSDELPKIDYIKDWLDVLPIMWKNFSKEDTATLLAEDYPNLNAFNMEKSGFLNSPTDHYMRPFWRAIKISTLFYDKTIDMKHALQNSDISLTGNYGMCLEDKPNHVVVTNYLKQFMQTYKDVRKFSLSFLTELSHEYQNFLQLGDSDIVEFFEWLHREGHTNNTIIITFSDHGMRFGEIQHLYVARIENRMPFLNIVLPPSLKAKYPTVAKSMRLNQERLSSTFDLHATLRDILHGNYKSPGQFYVNKKLRGISLFKPLPEDRSCAGKKSSPYCNNCIKNIIDLSGDSGQSGLTLKLFQMVIVANKVLRYKYFKWKQ